MHKPIATYRVTVTVRPPKAATVDDPRPEPLTIDQLTEAIEDAVQRTYWDVEPGAVSVDVNATAERTDE